MLASLFLIILLSWFMYVCRWSWSCARAECSRVWNYKGYGCLIVFTTAAVIPREREFWIKINHYDFGFT